MRRRAGATSSPNSCVSPCFPIFRLPYAGAVVRKQDNVIRTLDLDQEAMWKEFKDNARDNINTARKLGVKVMRDPTGARLDDFLRIYAHTIERRQAAPAAAEI